MQTLAFELSNSQRQYLGLMPVEPHWELVALAGSYVYFDGDVIRKKISITPSSYYECELNEVTAENRTLLMPKTARGKAKKLNYTATLSFSPFGVYFKFSSSYLCIANYTTQSTFYDEQLQDQTLDDLQVWLADWIGASTAQDLIEIDGFKTAKRKHQKIKAGDFFAFKIGRREWGFGRILLDISLLRKDKTFKANKNYGLSQLMGKSLIIKVYRHIQCDKAIELDQLAAMQSMPAQAIMDNQFYYGEHPIIGHLPLQDADLEDLLISYHPSISGEDKDTVYVQYGLIYKEMSKAQHQTLIDAWTGNALVPEHRYFRNEGIGFSIDFDSDRDYLKQTRTDGAEVDLAESSLALHSDDLRDPNLYAVKAEIFKAFGLDAALSYAENLKLFQLE